jgi:hypothetical protein
METKDLLRALQDIEKRAERVYDDAQVIETYVDAGGLVDALMTHDNGVVYGRRGTGKTHALKYLAETRRAAGDFVLYIDIEQDLGSTEGLYGDGSLPIAERASRLLVDVLAKIHDAMMEDGFEGRGDLATLEAILDHFGEVVVADEAEAQQSTEDTRQASSGGTVGASLGATGIPSLSAGLRSGTSSGTRHTGSLTTRGPIRTRVHFGAVTDLMRKAVTAHPAKRFWLLFDEWSGLPLELQPYLAEMLRRLFFGLPKVTTRIGAIPHRSEWRILRADGNGYIGVEVGAELFPLLDLDEFVIFPARSRDEQTTKSTEFFKNLLHRHLNRILSEENIGHIEHADETTRLLFTQITALQELVRAAEGVPRDALNIVARAAVRAGDTRIATTHVRAAAAQVFTTTKAALLNGVPLAQKLLDVIIQDVISAKKARAFLLLQEHTDNPLIQRLVDDRILHIIKRGYSHSDRPGIRYDVLQIDYGCYVQLLNTQSAPQSLFGVQASEEQIYGSMYSNVTVPEDDYRAIRRAVLDLDSKLELIGVPRGS